MTQTLRPARSTRFERREQRERPEIARALQFISANLEQPITVADVARAAHLSEFHLHRVFHAAVGESIGRFITRRRLEVAALRLAYEHDRSITDIALSSGYSSSSNFAKAFTAYFGCSPSRVREPEPGVPASVGKLLTLYGQDFQPSALYTVPERPDREQRRHEAALWNERVRFETTEGLTFACLASPGGYAFEHALDTWLELIERARQLGLAGGADAADGAIDAWGIVHDSPQVTAPELCRYHACIPCPAQQPLAAPLFPGVMPAGRYAVFTYAGAVADVGAAYRSIYSCWFPESSLAPDGFETLDHYVNDFPEDGQLELELWFRIRPRRL